MLIYIYGIKFDSDYAPVIQSLLERMVQRGIEVSIFEEFERFLTTQFLMPEHSTFSATTNFEGVNALFSIGGDGTLLDAATLIGSRAIPVLGFNTGRLGFLSHVSIAEVDAALDLFINGEFEIERRSLIHVESNQFTFGHFPYALNEVTINNASRNEMINVHASIDGKFLSNYWADGLIIATPTGSTAYSLSCGGPIVTPECKNFILTPISAHNLTARPLVISDSSKVQLKATARNGNILITLDSEPFVLESGCEIILAKAPFELHMILLKGRNFFRTIRKKMGWGLDIRQD